MAAASPASVRKQIAQGKADPVYLLVGDDDEEMARLAREFTALVEDALRAFNSERLYAGEKGVTPAAVAQAARVLPMMSDRRLVVVLRAEKMLKPKRRGKGDAEAGGDAAGADVPTDLDVLDEYVRNPVPETTLVLVATEVDRTRKVFKALQKHATIVECWGLKSSVRDPKKIQSWELQKIAGEAAALAVHLAKESGYSLDRAGAALLARRAGTNIGTLRGDIGRLLLYAGGNKTITVQDVQEVVSGETLQDDWALTEAIIAGDCRTALRQLGLAMESGGIPYMILGQISYCVREKLVLKDPRRVPAGVETLFRTDLALKSSGGDPRVLLERCIVELCGG